MIARGEKIKALKRKAKGVSSKTVGTRGGKLLKVLFIPDQHIPYNSKLVWKMLLAVIREFKPDIIVIMGDFGDFYAVSSHLKDPGMGNDLNWEIQQVKAALWELRKAAPKSRIVYIEGNHEDRLRRYLWENAPELFGLVSTKKLLDLDLMDIEFVPYGDDIQLGVMHATHDLDKAGDNAHRLARADYEGCAAIGHTHGMEFSVKSNIKGTPAFGVTFGWGGDHQFIKYTKKRKAVKNNIHGFGIGYLESDTGHIHVTPHPIVDGKVVVEGKLLKVA